MKICVTGASGKAGRAVVAELVAHGYRVRCTDLVPPPPGSAPDADGLTFIRADLTDYGQAAEVLAGVDAVVHLANIPAPGLRTPAVTFNENMTMNYNVFSAAAVTAGLSRVVWASSETTLGLPFDTPPRYAPVDEDHYPVPTSSYALSKVASETIADQIAGWRCGSPTASGPRTTCRSRRPGRTQRCAGGTCGATSTSGTPRRPAGWPWKPRWPAARRSSSRPPTP